jgi:phosphate-selective porin OprO/OprP
MKSHSLLYASAACAALCAPAYADDAAIEKRLDAMQHMIETQQHQIENQNAQIKSLRGALKKKGVHVEAAANATPAAEPIATPQQIAAQNARIDELNRKFDETQAERHTADAQAKDTSWSFKNGRPTITSRDGRFSLAIRALGQFDAAYYMQGAGASHLPAANGPDLASGTNIRRAQFGIRGTLFGDWSYNLNYDLGGSANEAAHIQALYVQYDGLKPFAFRIGAFPPAIGLEDSTSASDTPFLERAAPSDILRSAIGGAGRDAASILYMGDHLFGALSLSGSKAGAGASFDEQESVIGRLAYSPWHDADSSLVVSATAADMFRGNDTVAGPGSPRPFTLSVAPELTVDSNGIKLVSTGAADTQSAKFWGVEAGGTWHSLYAQAGYFGYEMDPRVEAPAPAKPDLNFSGWYAQATWVITGQSRSYSTSTAAFTPPKADGTWGTWELAGRYSDVDLNDKTGMFGLATPYGGVRGGEQKVWTAGINWYPNSALRFALDYQWIDVNRLSGAGADVGQNLQALSLRTQIAL